MFPASSPLKLRPSAEAFGRHAERFSGGHAARWFAATNGQHGEAPFAGAHYLCSLEDALAAVRIADELRAQPDGYWVEPCWLPIASDGAGQHFMIDDRDGRVLGVAHDDDHVEVIAESPEAWLERLLDGHAQGTVVWDEVFGLIDKAELDRIHESRAQAERERNAPLPLKHKLLLALMISLTLLVMGFFTWFVETHR